MESPAIRRRVEEVQDFLPTETFTAPAPVISDAKIYGGGLYLMSAGLLHQVGLTRGEVRSITSFELPGEKPSEPGKLVTLFFFTFLDNGKLVLAHPAMMWDHDLWTADLPFLKSTFIQ